MFPVEFMQTGLWGRPGRCDVAWPGGGGGGMLPGQPSVLSGHPDLAMDLPLCRALQFGL